MKEKTIKIIVGKNSVEFKGDKINFDQLAMVVEAMGYASTRSVLSNIFLSKGETATRLNELTTNFINGQIMALKEIENEGNGFT